MIRNFIFFSALGISALNAQTLTHLVHEPQIGNIEKVRQLDTSAFTSGLPLGTVGANSYWDFSNAQALNTETLTNYYVAPSTFTHGALYPGATILQDLPGDMFTYFKHTTTPTVQTEIVGIQRPEVAMTFTNSAIVIQYPASLGFSITDDVSGTYTVGMFNGPVTGETQTMADGTGTLVLGPGAVFTDVIRLKSVQTLTLTQGTLTGKAVQTVYNFYSASQKYPIVNITYISTSLGLGSPSVTAGMFANADNYSTVGLTENNLAAQKLQVFPNPASDLLYLHSGNGISVNSVAVYNVAGSEVITKNGEAAGVIDISALSAGVYLLKVESTAGIIHRKIVVTR